MTLVVAHRGASRDFPENTVESFRAAKAQNATMVELDVRRTRDGFLVVHHDPEVRGGAHISESDAKNLPSTVPGLVEAVVACAPLAVNVEIKNSPGEAGYDPTGALALEAVALLEELEGCPEIRYSCFDLPTLNLIRGSGTRFPTGYLVLDPTTPTDAIALAVAGGHGAIHPWDPCVTQSWVQACRDAGLDCNVWTVDDPERMVQLAEWGVTSIITNVPGVAVDALGVLGH